MHTLADQLKYFDPVLERISEDDQTTGPQSMEDQQWLQALSSILKHQQYPQSSSAAPSQELNTQIDHQFDAINQQFSELNMQYNANYAAASEQQPAIHYQDQQLQPQETMNYNNSFVPAPVESNNYDSYSSGYYDPYQQQSQQPLSIVDPTPTVQPEVNDPNSYLDQSQQQQQQWNQEQAPVEQLNYDYWNQSQSQNEVRII